MESQDELLQVHSSGFPNLDKLLGGGFKEGCVYVIASRPGVGKTTLALQLMANMNVPSVYFSASEDIEILGDKHHDICDECDGCDSVFQTTFVGTQNPSDCVWHSKHENERERLVIVDYLQALSIFDPPRTRYEEIDQFMRDWKRTTSEPQTNVTILLSQVSRDVEGRSLGIPQLKDLKDCSSIEEIADCVIFLTRRDYYDKLDKPGISELTIAKNRNGPLGTVYLQKINGMGMLKPHDPNAISEFRGSF